MPNLATVNGVCVELRTRDLQELRRTHKEVPDPDCEKCNGKGFFMELKPSKIHKGRMTKKAGRCKCWRWVPMTSLPIMPELPALPAAGDREFNLRDVLGSLKNVPDDVKREIAAKSKALAAEFSRASEFPAENRGLDDTETHVRRQELHDQLRRHQESKKQAGGAQ